MAHNDGSVYSRLPSNCHVGILTELKEMQDLGGLAFGARKEKRSLCRATGFVISVNPQEGPAVCVKVH